LGRTIGANVAAILFQAIGLAAYLLPCCLAGRATIQDPNSRPFSLLLGLVVLTLAAASLLSISIFIDVYSSVHPGGVVGYTDSRWLLVDSNRGRDRYLIAFAATGLLLATSFSFVGLYERLLA